MHKGNYPNPLI